MSTEIDRLLENANDAYYKNDYDTAVRLFEEILKKDNAHVASLQKLARIENARNNKARACEYYEKSLSVQPDDANTLNDLGNIWFDLREWEKAMKSYKKAIAVQKDYYWAYFNVGLCLRQKYPGDREKNAESREWFEKTIALNADYYPAYNEIGLQHLDRDELDAADEVFQKAIKICPSYKYPYFNCALIEKKRGNVSKSRQYLLKAIELDPDYVPALNNLGILAFDEKDYDAAFAFYAKALERDPKYLFALYNMGLAFGSIEEYKKAHQMYLRALETDPAYAPAIEEKTRLEREYEYELRTQSGLTDRDFKSTSYNKKAETKGKREQEHDQKDHAGEGAAREQTEKPGETELYTEKFGRNITALARKGKLFDVLGRDREIRSVMEVLMKMKKNNPLIVGRAGVGKTAIVEGIAARIAEGKVPPFFKDKEILEINMGMLVAGTQFRGDFEKRLQRIIDEVAGNDKIILFIDEIHTVLGAGETTDSSLDAANIMKPALARGDLRMIGATTTEEYNKHFIKDQAFQRRFYPVHIEELDMDSTLAILGSLKPRMMEHYHLEIDDSLLSLIVNLANDEIKNRVFPDKAIDILENACSRSAFDGRDRLDELTVKGIVGEFVGIKFLEVEKDKGQSLLGLESFLKERVYGQDEAIEKVAKIVRLTKQKLDLKPEQPDGVFFFAGPTGVGKTYLAKQLAHFLFGSEEKLVSINMAEFTEPHSVSKLIGAPPGYVGYNDIPIFSSTILENPSTLLLLDEIEKAHPEVLKLFLEIFDEGKVRDTQGRVIYFSNVTIIMTSNAGCKGEGGIGFGQGTGEAAAESVDLTQFFPVEFLNRIDEIIMFRPIEKDTARNILKNLLIKRAKKTFEKRGIRVDFDMLFVEHILERGFSLKYGVRNLERMFEKEVLATAANYLFENPGNKTLLISVENGKVKVV